MYIVYYFQSQYVFLSALCGQRLRGQPAEKELPRKRQGRILKKNRGIMEEDDRKQCGAQGVFSGGSQKI